VRSIYDEQFKNAGALWSDLPLLGGDLYGLDGTLSLTSKALYAVGFSGWVRLLLRSRMPRGVRPVEKAHRADFYADAVSFADIPINAYTRPMYPEFLGRFNWPPNIVTIMLIDNLSLLLEIRIYRQIDSPSSRSRMASILSLLTSNLPARDPRLGKESCRPAEVRTVSSIILLMRDSISLPKQDEPISDRRAKVYMGSE